MTSNSERILLPKPEGTRCFGCGDRNPLGLNMSFYTLGTTLRSDITLNEHHMGWENIAHGGIISTVLDEIMGWTVIAFRRTFFVTRSIEVHYLRPVRLNSPLTAVGEIETDHAPKGCSTRGCLFDSAGAILAEGRAQMVYLSEKRLPVLPETYRNNMIKLFERIRELLE